MCLWKLKNYGKVFNLICQISLPRKRQLKNTKMRTVSRKNLNRAIDYLKSTNEVDESEKSQNNALHRIESHCKVPLAFKRRTPPITSFSKNLILTELKSHLVRRDWNQLKPLFLSLLHRCTDLEPLIWRYLFVISLYSSNDNLSQVEKFFETCIGSQSEETSEILRNFLILSDET